MGFEGYSVPNAQGEAEDFSARYNPTSKAIGSLIHKAKQDCYGRDVLNDKYCVKYLFSKNIFAKLHQNLTVVALA
jgi:hypothetical protein